MTLFFTYCPPHELHIFFYIFYIFLYFQAWSISSIARNLGHETPRAVTRGNLKTDRDAEVYRDLYGHSRKMANVSLRLKENKNVQLNHNRLLYYGANYVKITTK